jgi:hypothetical protein
VQCNLLYQIERVGQRGLFGMYGSGPASYSPTTGDVLSMPDFYYLDAVFGDPLSVSKNYYVRPFPSTVGTTRATWAWKWYYAGSAGQGLGVDGVVISTAGTGQTNGTYTISGTGGGGTGAQVSVTIAGGAITGVSVVNPGTGYTSAPTFTVAEGGTPGTLTATIGSIGGVEVGAGTNLSGESVQFAALGGEF